MQKQTRTKPYDLVSINTNHPSGDAFGRLRVSTPDTIFDSKLLYGKSNGTYWSEQLNGTGTSVHDSDESCVDLAVSSNGDFAIRQTRQRFNYQAGKSQLFYLTGIIGFGSGITSRIGAFHGGTTTPFSVLDGVCFESENGILSVCIYKAGIKTQSAVQSEWNMDKLDGKKSATNLSGVLADWTKAQIFVIDFEWLGVGRVRFGLNIDGITYYVHEFYNANIIENVYMRSGNQPLRYEIRSTGGSGSMKHICGSVQSEGGFNPKGLQANVGTGISPITIGAGWELLYAIRLKATQLDATVIVQDISVITTSNVNYQIGLFFNPTIGGTPTWSDVQGAAIQEIIGDGSTNTITPVIRMYGQFTDRTVRTVSKAFDTSLNLGSTIDGVQDVIALGARTLSGTGDFVGSLQLKQLS